MAVNFSKSIKEAFSSDVLRGTVTKSVFKLDNADLGLGDTVVLMPLGLNDMVLSVASDTARTNLAGKFGLSFKDGSVGYANSLTTASIGSLEATADASAGKPLTVREILKANNVSDTDMMKKVYYLSFQITAAPTNTGAGDSNRFVVELLNNFN